MHRWRALPTFAVLAVLAGVLAHPAAAGAAGTDGAPGGGGAAPRVLLALLPQHEDAAYSVKPPLQPKQQYVSPSDQVLDAIAAQPQLSLGLVSASQGAYRAQQAVLDISQGTRVSRGTYTPPQLPIVLLRRLPDGRGELLGWHAVVARAASAPQTIEPGLLASSVPGGAGYAGVRGASQLDAIVATDRAGRIAAVTVGSSATIVARTQALLARQRFVVANLPPDAAGEQALARLIAERAPGEQVIAMQTPPDARGHQMLPIGITGPGAARGLTSGTTTLPGIVAGIDIAPTVLDHLGVTIPTEMRGQAIERSGSHDANGLRDLRDRFFVLGQRRVPALEIMLLVWLGLVLVLGARNGLHRGSRPAFRVGALAFMWLPVTVLIGPLLDTADGLLEILAIVVLSFGLGALTDRWLPWPRGPMLPAFTSVAVLAVDAAAGSHLLIRSLLGPNPSYGSRFFGIGNELKSGLTCLLLIGLAAAFGSRQKSARLAWIVAGSGVLLGIVIGAGRLGAGVGGVIVVAAGVATATLLMIPGRPSKRAIALGILSPVAALGALVVLDLATAGGQGHLSHDVLHAGGGRNLTDIVERRTTLAWQGLIRGRMPLVVLAAGCGVWFAVRNRWIFARAPYPMWTAALWGGLAAGVVGSVAEDSGPLLFVVAVFVLGAAIAYLLGDPRLAAEPPPGWQRAGGADQPREDESRPAPAPVPG